MSLSIIVSDKVRIGARSLRVNVHAYDTVHISQVSLSSFCIRTGELISFITRTMLIAIIEIRLNKPLFRGEAVHYGIFIKININST